MLVTMNDHELQRFSIIQDVLNNKLKHRDAISILGISYRHLVTLGIIQEVRLYDAY